MELAGRGKKRKMSEEGHEYNKEEDAEKRMLRDGVR